MWIEEGFGREIIETGTVEDLYIEFDGHCLLKVMALKFGNRLTNKSAGSNIHLRT